MDISAGICFVVFFFRTTPLIMTFTLYHREVVGTNRLPLSIRQARSLEACLFFCVPKCCLKLSAATDLLQKEGNQDYFMLLMCHFSTLPALVI